MNQLRRLASYVVDSSQHLKPALKHMEPSYKHLDLTYVTPRVLVGGRPVDGPTDKKACVNNAVELKLYLEDEHANRYLIFNLCDDEAPVISPQTLEFSWERDGGLRTYTPPSDHIFRICYAIFAWLALDPENVAVIYCHNGKTRSGVVVACYFLFSRLVDDPMTALAQFYQKRLGIETLTPDYVRRSMPVSIQRFVTNFGTIMEHQAIPNPDPLLLKAIMFRALPVELQPLIQIWDDWHLIFSNAKDAVSDHVPPVVDWNPEDGFLAILWDGGIPLDGGFSILCSFGDDVDAEMDATSRVLFRYMDSTWFLSPGLVTLKKANLDMMKQYEHGFEDENFSVDMVFHNSNVPPRLIVPVDYTGNYAVKQGIVEIAAKHTVAPDPSMYLNFVKTGFDATASTYALQRAQNAPNLALDILHSEALTTIFTRLPPSPTSRDESLSQPVHEDSIKPSSLFATTSSTPRKASSSSLSEAHCKASSSSSTSSSAETLVVTPPKGFSVPRATEPSPSSRRSSASSSYHDVEPDGDSVCVLCHEEDYVLRPQLVRCCGCQKCFHTGCAGLKKVPFGLTTMSDRTNHAAYMKKFFLGWRCTNCAAASSSSSLSSTSSSSGFVTEPKSPNHDKYEQLKELLSAKGISMDDLLRAADANLVKPTIDGHATDKATTDAVDVTDKYKRMVDMGVPLAAAQNGMVRDGLDPTLLHGYAAPPVVAPAVVVAEPVLQLRDAIQFEGYFTMLSKGISKDAVKHKMRMCGLNPKILDLDPKASYLEVKSQIEALQAEVIYPSGSPPKPSSAKSPPKSAPATFVVPDKAIAPTDSSTTAAASTTTTTTMVAPAAAVDAPAAVVASPATPLSKETADAPKPAAAASEPPAASEDGPPRLRDDATYGKYFKMLKMNIPEGAVRQKMIEHGVNLKALELGPDGLVSDLDAPPAKPLLKDDPTYGKYFKMLKMNIPEDAVRQKMMEHGVNLKALELGPDGCVDDLNSGPPKVLLKDDPTYGKYFKMLKMNIPEGAVRQKMIEHGVNVKALELGPDGCVDDLNAPPPKVLLKDDPTYGKYFKMLKMNIPEGAVRQKMIEHGANPKALELGPNGCVDDLNAPPPKVLLKDDPTYGKYFKMLTMNIPEGAVRQKMIEHGVNIKALELGPDGYVDDLVVKVLLKDDPTYGKYFKMLKMNIPEGAVRQKMLEHGVNPRALELGPGAYVSQLDDNNSCANDTPPLAPKKPARRKKLFWQPIPDDRLKSGHQSTIWEAKGDDEIKLEMDMDEIESLFFAKADSKTKKTAAKPLARKQAVTLVDGKRAMNAAIALARIKLTYAQVAAAIGSLDACGLTLEQLVTINEYLPTDDEVGVVTRYAGDPDVLGEAEKFFAAIATVPRYSLKMECLITKSSFQTRVAEIDASVTNVTRACDDVKGSRLLKLLLGMVLKLGNTLNGGEETEHAIRGFSVDSLLRLGITKTVDNKTTVLHYLVRVIKKNQPLVLDFAKELEHVPLAAREATEAIDQALSSLSSSVQKLADERDRVKTEGIESLLATYEASVAATEADLSRLRSGVDHMKAQIAAVLDYFGEDPAKKPADFFQTLSSFCQAFEKAKAEVQTADDAKQRADRLLHRRTSSSIDMSIPSRLLEEKAAGMRQKAMTFRTKSTSLTDL